MLSTCYLNPRFHKFIPYRSTIYENIQHRWFSVTLLLFFVLLITWRPLSKLSEKFYQWVKLESHILPRSIIALCVCFIIFTFQTRAHWGFWWFSIGGWTYEGAKDSIYPDTNPTAKQPNIPPFIESGIRKDVARFVDRSTPKQVSGQLLFLHYKTGEVLPFNFGLYEIPFPEFILKTYRGKNLKQHLAQLAHYKLNVFYKRGYGFLLPSWMAYPKHSNYAPIDYASYPHPSHFEYATVWSVDVKIPTQGEPFVSRAEFGNKFPLHLHSDS